MTCRRGGHHAHPGPVRRRKKVAAWCWVRRSTALRLAVALVLGAVIGVERQWRQRAYGLRTNARDSEHPPSLRFARRANSGLPRSYPQPCAGSPPGAASIRLLQAVSMGAGRRPAVQRSTGLDHLGGFVDVRVGQRGCDDAVAVSGVGFRVSGPATTTRRRPRVQRPVATEAARAAGVHRASGLTGCRSGFHRGPPPPCSRREPRQVVPTRGNDPRPSNSCAPQADVGQAKRRGVDPDDVEDVRGMTQRPEGDTRPAKWQPVEREHGMPRSLEWLDGVDRDALCGAGASPLGRFISPRTGSTPRTP